jgi:hypothetical protein
MRRRFHERISWLFAVVVILAQVSPAAAEVLVCAGNGSNPLCCDQVSAAEPRPNDSPLYLNSSDCDCCITLAVASDKAEAAAKKAFDDLFDTTVVRSAFSPTVGCLAGRGGDAPRNPRLSSLGTVVLLI